MDFDYSCISDVVDALCADSAQQYLNLGWILLNTVALPSGEDSCIVYSLGWNGMRGEAKRP